MKIFTTPFVILVSLSKHFTKWQKMFLKQVHVVTCIQSKIPLFWVYFRDKIIDKKFTWKMGKFMSTVNLIKIIILNNCYSLLLIFIEINTLLIFSHHKFLRFNSSLKSLYKKQPSSFQNVLKIYQYCAILSQNELNFKVQLQWIPVVQHLFWVFPLKCFVQ